MTLYLCTDLTGCSSNQKSEEVLKAEIDMEMEAEQKLREKLEAEIRAQMKAEQSPNEELEESSLGTQNSGNSPIVLSVLMTIDEIKIKFSGR
ncbi:MAG: hypothetical protein SCK28_15720 [Bacillota bacterium]|nr:hypothetical protein [Bacillota bacterium]